MAYWRMLFNPGKKIFLFKLVYLLVFFLSLRPILGEYIQGQIENVYTPTNLALGGGLSNIYSVKSRVF